MNFNYINVFFHHQDYTEDYIQIGPGQLYALSTRMFSVDRVSVPYSWNHTISYESSRAKMPYLVQTLHASSMSAHYRPLEETLEFTIYASISKGEVHTLVHFHECKAGMQHVVTDIIHSATTL